VQLKEDLRRCAESLKESADSFKNAVDGGYQILNWMLDACRSPPHDGGLGEAKPISEPGRLLTVKQVAAYLGVSDRSIYLWIRQKNFPFRKVGEDLRFDLAEVEAWTRPESNALEKAPLRVVK
jgi:excisionase family DNA binding protein